MQKSYRKYALLFILPVIITFLIAVLIPFFMGIYLSFFKFKTLRNTQFIGIQNYLYVFSDKAFLRALWFMRARRGFYAIFPDSRGSSRRSRAAR